MYPRGVRMYFVGSNHGLETASWGTRMLIVMGRTAPGASCGLNSVFVEVVLVCERVLFFLLEALWSSSL